MVIFSFYRLLKSFNTLADKYIFGMQVDSFTSRWCSVIRAYVTFWPKWGFLYHCTTNDMLYNISKKSELNLTPKHLFTGRMSTKLMEKYIMCCGIWSYVTKCDIDILPDQPRESKRAYVQVCVTYAHQATQNAKAVCPFLVTYDLCILRHAIQCEFSGLTILAPEKNI